MEANCSCDRALDASARAVSTCLQTCIGSILFNLCSRSLDKRDDLELLFLIIKCITEQMKNNEE
jgi:hypothetical protein